MKIKTCPITGREYALTNQELEARKVFDLPQPDLCPEERYRRLLGFLPEKHFFLRNCDASGAKLFSIFVPDCAFPVYNLEYWRSSEWDPLSYGQKFDFKRLFLEQLLELWRHVPRPATWDLDTEQSRVIHNVEKATQCYLCFDGHNLERCLYSVDLADCVECVDCYRLENCSGCYQTINSLGCSELRYSENSINCQNSWFLSNCRDCTECLFCSNLTGKTNYVFNQPVTKSQFDQSLRELSLGARPLLELARNRFVDFLAEQDSPHIFAESASEVSGNVLFDCTHTYSSFECSGCADVFHGHNLRSVDSSYELISCEDVSLSTQSVALRHCKNTLNSVFCNGVTDAAYSAYCENSSDIFGCVGLRDKQHCIFNMQFDAENYKGLRDQIVQHMKDRSVWGAPLPMNFSGHAYNHSAANEYMPLTKIPAKMMGFHWDESDRALRPSELVGDSKGSELFSEIPERMNEIDPATAAKATYICTLSGKPFQLTKAETEFYRKAGLPPPSLCFQQRHLERLAHLTPHALFERKCVRSGEKLHTAIPPKSKRNVVAASTVSR